MLKLDLTNTGLKYNRHIKPSAKKVKKIHNKLISKTSEGYQFTDWLNWPINYYKDEIEKINWRT